MSDLPDGQLARLEDRLAELGSVVVAFSGGVDSGLLALVARRTLGDDALAATAVSPSLSATERSDVEAQALELGLAWRPVATDELERAAYRANDAQRCAHCKDALMDAVAPLAAERGATVVLGVNVDDLGDHRPGQAAASARGAAFPLVDAGLTKADVRALARHLGLRTWDKPAAPCLASRVPYGTPVSLGVLRSVERAEAAVRALGFADLRVRHHGEVARVEVPLEDLDRLRACWAEVVVAVRAAGYPVVELEAEGLRSGRLNDALVAPATVSAHR